MTSTDSILAALSSMEDRLAERIGEQIRELRLDMNEGFDAVLRRLDRLEARRIRDLAGSGLWEGNLSDMRRDR